MFFLIGCSCAESRGLLLAIAMWVASTQRRCVLWRVRRTTSTTLLGSISVQLSTNTCPGGGSRHNGFTFHIPFHIPEKFPLRGRISRKTVFLGYKRVPCLCPGYGSRKTFCDAYTVSIPWWTSHRFILPRWLLLMDILFSSYPRPNVFESCATVSAMAERRCLYFFQTRMTDLHWSLHQCTFSSY